MFANLGDRRAGLLDKARGNALSQKIPHRVVVIWKLEGSDMVYHLVVELFRHVVTKRTVACLHVMDGNVHSLSLGMSLDSLIITGLVATIVTSLSFSKALAPVAALGQS